MITLHFACGAITGYVLREVDAAAWAAHWYARLRGGQWFTPRQECPGCHRRVHVLRPGPPGPNLCPACSGLPQ